MDLLNFRSDTQTLPTPAMYEAIRTSPLGDDTYDEDPTVHKLERMAADLLGKEAAMLVLSGNMANLTALLAHARPGDEVLLDPESHIFYYEGGGLASVAGLMPMPVPSRDGSIDPDDLRRAIRPRNLHFPAPRLLCLENTHNRSGGRVMVLEFGQPRNRAFRMVYDFYRRRVLPNVGGAVTGRKEAYEYLESSSARFPCGDDFAELMRGTGRFASVEWTSLTFGIAYLYKGVKV